MTKKKTIKKKVVKKKRIRNRSANKDPDKLTLQQRKFVNYYLQSKEKGGDNITRAYYHAYPNTKNDNNAGSSGHKLLLLPKIVRIVDEARKAAVEATGMTAKETILSIANMSKGDINDYITWNQQTVNFKNSDELTPEQTKRIRKIKVTKTGIEFELEPRGKYHEMLARHHGLFEKDIDTENLSPHMVMFNFLNQKDDKGD